MNLFKTDALQKILQSYITRKQSQITLCLLMFIPQFSMADLQGMWDFEPSKVKDTNWTLKTEAIAYLYNYEWFQRHGAEGYTLFGNLVPIYGSKQLQSHVQLDLGAIGFLTYGNENNNSLKPLVRINIDLGQKKNFILGTLNQTHNIHSALSLDNDLYQQKIEQGIQFINTNPNNTIDTWANWKIAETQNHAEHFEVGIIHNWIFFKHSKFNLFTNEQILIDHKGGQLTTDQSAIRGFWSQMGLGARYNNQEILVKLLNSSFRENQTPTIRGVGLEASYTQKWHFQNNTQLTFKANQYVSDNFYNPTAHPGYNQKSFTQFNIDATFLRNDQLNISTGLSLDWINGSFSTVQYLNVTLLDY